ncbi:hypothetical protein [Nocardia sp. NPDC051981]|uniref:hypothetical protein n=1 Tax=Nocardia sp. NPDC051981 TaxID=3155417 RepID=UPI00341A1EEF
MSLAAFAFQRYSDHRDQLATERSARDTACEYVKALTDYDLQNIDSLHLDRVGRSDRRLQE